MLREATEARIQRRRYRRVRTFVAQRVTVTRPLLVHLESALPYEWCVQANNLFKKRVAPPGRGKSGSARVSVGTNLGDRWFFLFGFEKKERDNINDRELAALKKLRAHP
jgi:hypothetical protein